MDPRIREDDVVSWLLRYLILEVFNQLRQLHLLLTIQSFQNYIMKYTLPKVSMFRFCLGEMLVKNVIKLFLLSLLVSDYACATLRYPGEQVQYRLNMQDKLIQDESVYKNFAADRNIQSKIPTKAEKVFMDTFMSFKDFMEESLHNPDWGYYGAGNVIFTREHFLTVPKQISPAFGAMIAYQSYAMWRSMVLSGEMKDDESFYIIEFGAGDGDLAYDILDSIQRNIDTEKHLNVHPQWQHFYRLVKYYIGERAPALCVRQRTRNQKFIDEKKCEIINTDARDAKKYFSQKIKGLVLSNELLDTFCLHKILVSKNKPWKVCYLLPILKKGFFDQNTDPSLDRFKTIFEELNCYNREVHAEFLKGVNLASDDLILSKKDYLYFKAHEKKQGNSLAPFLRLEETYVIGVDLIDELVPYMKMHGNYLKHQVQLRDMTRNRFFYVNYSASQFIREASALLDSGFVMTIDYGETSLVHDWQLTHPSTAIRMYPERMSCYQEPGSADITSDVNFTDLYFTGKACGLDLSFYGCQKALQATLIVVDDQTVLAPFDMKNELFSPVLPDAAIDYFCTSRSATMFKMLIQKKVSAGNGYKLLAPSDLLFPAW